MHARTALENLANKILTKIILIVGTVPTHFSIFCHLSQSLRAVALDTEKLWSDLDTTFWTCPVMPLLVEDWYIEFLVWWTERVNGLGFLLYGPQSNVPWRLESIVFKSSKFLEDYDHNFLDITFPLPSLQKYSVFDLLACDGLASYPAAFLTWGKLTHIDLRLKTMTLSEWRIFVVALRVVQSLRIDFDINMEAEDEDGVTVTSPTIQHTLADVEELWLVIRTGDALMEYAPILNWLVLGMPGIWGLQQLWPNYVDKMRASRWLNGRNQGMEIVLPWLTLLDDAQVGSLQ
ncbi:hypothetical protein M413DRAFT_13391 [Hebeloma cylindrosporum]|uniref:Uncharacterized protein n=1 Tax=Hebeloma cylindrosporum TaxID=76867 RepID=A0A0C3BL67_HEBCY|nr:hypothetical protein M413DRAFT_13391 [Hebeloma cylindrosporum h7]